MTAIENSQLGLPFPLPFTGRPWPNRLGFDYQDLEFWCARSDGWVGCRNIETGTYGLGHNWVSAFYDYLTNPKECT